MSKLFIVPTPIGNLKDITIRAIDTLQTVDIIYAEDTRTSLKLLNHYEISTPMQSFHMHNEHAKINNIVSSLSKARQQLSSVMREHQAFLILDFH